MSRADLNQNFFHLVPPVGPTASRSRLTVHHFVPPDVLVQVIAPQNKDARFPTTVERWPPAFLTDFWYGCAALRRWGIPQAVSLMHTYAHSSYYDDGDDGEAPPALRAGRYRTRSDKKD